MAVKCRKCNKEVKDRHICKGKGKTSGMFGSSPCTDCGTMGKQRYNGRRKHWR